MPRRKSEPSVPGAANPAAATKPALATPVTAAAGSAPEPTIEKSSTPFSRIERKRP